MKAHLIRRGKHYAVKFLDAQSGRWSHRSLKTTKKAIAAIREGRALNRRAERSSVFRSMHQRWRPCNRCSRKNMRQATSSFIKAMVCPGSPILESFRSLLKRCGFKRSGVHILRHTFGAHLAQKDVDMAIIRDLLGHHSVTLTEKYYAHLAPSNLSLAVQKLHPADAF